MKAKRGWEGITRMGLGKAWQLRPLNFHSHNYLNSLIYNNQAVAQYYLQLTSSSGIQVDHLPPFYQAHRWLGVKEKNATYPHL